MFKPMFLLLIGLVLVGCGTPQEQCIAKETRDLRVVDRLISDISGNLGRGYAYEDVTISSTVWVTCDPLPVPPPVEGAPPLPPAAPRLCLDDREQTVTRPVAIDLAAEQAKLSGLKTKRKQLVLAANRAIAACKKSYPE